MRTGFNPLKDRLNEKSDFIHQIIIPVYIPNHSGYFKDSFSILKLCLNSLILTIHNKSFITVVNNGSCDEVKLYLDELFISNKIQEIIHTTNIGKLNAILKGLAGNAIELVTISDCDVLFKEGWQKETQIIFNQIPKVGVVGLVPQFNMHRVNCTNLIYDNFFKNRLQFIKVKSKQDLIKFYQSIGWQPNYNKDYLQYALGLKWNDNLSVLIGSGHFVATYKKNIFDQVVSYIPYKLGGNSEGYLDSIPLKKDYWRVTTHDNYAYHLGNTLENWMNTFDNKRNDFQTQIYSNFQNLEPINSIQYFIKNKLFKKIIFNNFILKKFYIWKKLPKSMVNNY